MRALSDQQIVVKVFSLNEAKKWLSEAEGLGLIAIKKDISSSKAALVSSASSVCQTNDRGENCINLPLESIWAGQYTIKWFGCRVAVAQELEVFAVLARWVIENKAVELFEREMLKNGEASILQEEGCVAFGYGALCDTCIQGIGLYRFPESSEFLLIECFKSEQDFELHLRSEHFAAFRSAVLPHFLGDRSATIKGNGVLRLDTALTC